ncbi:pulmonary surfactant-associated protein C-like [Bombina bombina]|uniref:pulmonary surfactant-associated protein C-like n=1 Tax=Bombina bombina TaxID=8345 RepID=UPI00235B2BB6|nr:pulmonary surfactant-associated protein C-like [Bombina bombina]
MESKSTADLTNDPPDYTFLPRISERKSKWILLGTIGILLAFIIVGGCLIGVYLTQKHTEAVVEMVYNGQNGKEIQQTVMYSEKNNMAAFAISTQDNNATILYDFNSALIAIRVMNTEKCYVLRMNNSNSPSLKEIHKGIEYFQAEVSDVKFVYMVMYRNNKLYGKGHLLYQDHKNSEKVDIS